MRKVTLTITMEPETVTAPKQEALNIGKLCRTLDEALKNCTPDGSRHKITIKVQDTAYTKDTDTAEIVFMPHIIIVQ